MLGILSDVFKRATYQDFPRPELRGDWRPPVHGTSSPPHPVRRPSWRGERHD